MSDFTVHTPETAPEGSRAALTELRGRIGFIPNLAGMIGGAPAAIASFNAQQSALRETALTGAERELVGITVSLANSCPYSMAAHSTFATRFGLPADVVEALRADKEIADPRLRQLREFTRTLLRERGHVDPSSVDAMRRAGFGPGQILEVVTQAAYTTMANWVANVGSTPVDGAFEPMAWP
jgi:uncharacterized peroxidase-related enzyme